MSEAFELEVVVQRELYYSEESNFGIYGAITKNNEDNDKVKLNEYGNFVIKGVMPKMEENREYTCEVIEKKDKRGYAYEVQSVYQDIPTSVDEQKRFLSTILTPLQVMNIYDVYNGQDVIKLMKEDKFDYKLVKGFGESTYNKVREKILENISLQRALAELSKYGINYNVVAKLSKEYGSPELLVEKLKTNPYILTTVDGIGFKKCDELALKMGIEKTSLYRIEASVKHVLFDNANSNGHSWLSESYILKECSNLLELDKQYVIDYMEEEGVKHLHIDGEKIALKHLYNYEKDVFDNIQRLLKAKPSFEVENVDERISKTEESQGFKFTDEQRNAIKKATESNMLIISGKAGTGKTTILKGVINVFGKEVSYSSCALSGKASQRITESTGLDSSTIHRLLGFGGFDEGFAHDENNPLQSDVIVLDEASMVNSSIFASLMSAIKSGSKLIIIGDIEQLEPIGSGNILKDMIESGQVPTAMLTVVHRQAMKSGILSTANQVREGNHFNGKDDYENRVIGELKDLHFKPYVKAESVHKAIIKTCKQYKKSKKYDIMNFQVIVPMKKRGDISTNNLNKELQKIFNGENKKVLKFGTKEYKVDDKIIQNGNNYDAEVYNGTIGIIIDIDVNNKKLTINFSGNIVEYSKDEIGQIDLAYALTVHKVQGSQFENVVVGLDYSSYVLLGRQLVYTALTRAEKLCMLICQNDSLYHAVRTDKSSKRNTFLLEMLTSVDK